MLLLMSSSQHPISSLAGQSFRDHEGQRWWISGPRAGSDDQLIVHQQMQGSYLRVAVHVMTEPEFRACARHAGLEPDKPDAGRVPHGR
jgi:hypothetical protein